jgi:hypothetical protein
MSKPWKVIWLAFVSVMAALTVYSVLVNADAYFRSSTAAVIASTMAPLSDVTMPSFYLCNTNQAIEIITS